MSETKKSNLYEPKNVAKESPEKIERAFAFCRDYAEFLANSKTERQSVNECVKLAEAAGYREFNFGDSVKAGDKIYYVNRGHSVILADVKDNLADGVNLIAAHIDSPRIDLKPNPLYEDGGMAFFRTHYYGGLKKYQWPTIPLALIGTVVREDGTKVDICVGENENDPVFCIPDLLPHLDRGRDKKTLGEGFSGEMLNTLIASYPNGDYEKEPIVEAVLSYLKDNYNVTAEDLVSAELTLVPAGKVRDLGFDRSMMLGYGHDDKVCSYPPLRAMLDGTYTKTAVLVLSDKEEIGSDGVTGLDANYLRDFLYELAENAGVNPRLMLSKSICLSADVSACFDPTYPEAHERKNAAYLNCGVALAKYTGHGGKYGTSDAPAEVVAKMRRLFNAKGVAWQSAELGRVDLGGGGTLAKYVAKLNVEVLDVGVPVLSMYAPFEVVSKLDVYAMYEASLAFLANE
ncbi:MAG: aminopeptidase [Clostridia bacterium]|nr:aminopeptidase [Clostridia bacterium]